MRECPTCKTCFPDSVTDCPADGSATFFSIAGEPLLEGKYRLESRLGQGGMGVVYRARHNFLKTAHAVKVILPDLVGNDPNLITRFRQEAIAAAAIRHQNIVNVSDFGVVNGKMPFLVMEFVKGESLHELLLREKRLSPEKALQVLTGVCAGVCAAHRQGIVHRDLKPLNIMICADRPLPEAVKVLDFGLAKIKSGELLGSFVAAQTTGLMGSPFYMAPEQWSDDEPDARADVYSLGVILYQMLAGDVPFRGASIPAIMKKHLTDLPAPLVHDDLGLTAEVDAVVRHALEKDLVKRTSSVEDLVSELRQAINAPTNSAVTMPFAATDNHIHTAPITAQNTLSNQPFVALRILTDPPNATVFVDGKASGNSQDNGWLNVERIARGQHNLLVTSNGFYDFEAEIECDDNPTQVSVRLESQLQTNLIGHAGNGGRTTDLTGNNLIDGNGVLALQQSGNQKSALNIGVRSNPEVAYTPVPVDSQREISSHGGYQIQHKQKSAGLSKIIIGAAVALVLLVGVGLGLMSALRPAAVGNFNAASGDAPANAKINQTSDGATAVTPVTPKAEMALIDGGTFKMGNDKGAAYEKPIHTVTVPSFYMDKTEVTNHEYAEFIKQTDYHAPPNWVNAKPLSGQEKFPVANVDFEDAQAFARWRSTRDNATYRLPSEEEWEYAARNGATGTLFPWGSDYQDGKAVLGQPSLLPVGSLEGGANRWGVRDLIGNVWEWTSTPLNVYPGYTGDPLDAKATKNKIIIRGGAYNTDLSKSKISSATRNGTLPNDKQPSLGFRLVRSAS